MSKLAPTKTAALLSSLLFLTASTGAGSDLDKELPSQEGLVRYGCIVKGPIDVLDHRSPEGRRNRVWITTLWAEHDSPLKATPVRDWKLLYSYRKKRRKAFTDCDKFLDRVSKAEAEYAARRRPDSKPEAGTPTASLAASGAPLRPEP